MKRITIGIVIGLALVFVYNSFKNYQNDEKILSESSMLIEQQIKNVARMIVSEGHFAEVYNYSDSKKLLGSLITVDKKALVVVNAKVLITFDMKQIAFDIDEDNKVVRIKNLPKPKIEINPDLEYYDISADYLNPFEAEDYNLIRQKIDASLLEKVQASYLVSNAQNRLLTELAQFLVLTNNLGWTLVYNDTRIKNIEELNWTP